jgi:hypothetical protein
MTLLFLFFPIQDAKEHLFALADKLGPSLKDIDVCYLMHIVNLLYYFSLPNRLILCFC